MVNRAQNPSLPQMPQDFRPISNEKALENLKQVHRELIQEMTALQKRIVSVKKSLKETTKGITNKRYNKLLQQKEALNKDLLYINESIKECKENISQLEQEIATNEQMDREGIFGRSPLGRCVSAVAQTLALPVTLGLRLAADHPYMAAGLVISSQILWASATAPLVAAQQVFDTAKNISSANDLSKIGTDSEYPSDGHYQQVQDIDATNITQPIGHFNGTYEGNGKTINKLSTPLFNNLENANVSNLTLADSHITNITGLDNHLAIGTLANKALDSQLNQIKITNATFNIDESRYLEQGGIVGRAENSNITGSSINSLNIQSNFEKTTLGGIVGQSKNNTITSSSISDFTIKHRPINKTDAIKSNFFGGIVGEAENSAITHSTLNNISLNLTGEGSYVGGLIGQQIRTNLTHHQLNNLTISINAGSPKSAPIGAAVGRYAGGKISNLNLTNLDITAKSSYPIDEITNFPSNKVQTQICEDNRLHVNDIIGKIKPATVNELILTDVTLEQNYIDVSGGTMPIPATATPEKTTPLFLSTLKSPKPSTRSPAQTNVITSSILTKSSALKGSTKIPPSTTILQATPTKTNPTAPESTLSIQATATSTQLTEDSSVSPSIETTTTTADTDSSLNTPSLNMPTAEFLPKQVTISNIEELASIGLNGTYPKNAIYHQLNDIDASQLNQSIANFNGQYHGQGHSISGLTQPLFGNVENASISNLTFANSEIVNASCSAALTCKLTNSQINDIKFNNITINKHHLYSNGLGLVATDSADSNITDTSINNVNLTLTDSDRGQIGTLVGRGLFTQVKNTQIKNVNIQTSGDIYSYIGGVIGDGDKRFTRDQNGRLTSSEEMKDLTVIENAQLTEMSFKTEGRGTAVGGIIGSQSGGNLKDITQKEVTIEAEGENLSVGGLVGLHKKGKLQDITQTNIKIKVKESVYDGYKIEPPNDQDAKRCTEASTSADITVGKKNDIIKERIISKNIQFERTTPPIPTPSPKPTTITTSKVKTSPSATTPEPEESASTATVAAGIGLGLITFGATAAAVYCATKERANNDITDEELELNHTLVDETSSSEEEDIGMYNDAFLLESDIQNI